MEVIDAAERAATMPADNGAIRLRDAALALFGERGFAGTTVRAIAERADVTAGLVLHHYGSKEGLRRAVDRYVLDSISTAFAGLADATDATDATDWAGDTGGVAGITPGAASGSVDVRLRGFQTLFQQRPYMGRYLRRALLEGTEASVAFFDELIAVSGRMLESLRSAGQVRPTDDPQAQLLMAMLSGLMPVLLPRHIERHLGASLRSDEGVRRWAAAEYQLLTEGLLIAQGKEQS
ncbi:MAG: TetR family transcriptional regulator [Actinomycetota bacterium]|nr:TetR family transcriptional regulator [Actinomycetota bacterium]